MPFPLAHPAAVLPLRRYCPSFLSFPALVAGSISPDVGYLFGESGISDMSHTVLGGMPFGLIAGLLLLTLFYAAGAVTLKLPTSPTKSLGPLLQVRIGTPISIVLSLLIGIWTHLFFDSFTHAQGWVVLHCQLLQMPLFTFTSRQVRVCHFLWYFCSFTGVAWIVFEFRNWQDRQHAQLNAGSPISRLVEAVIIAVLVLPIELLHHIMRSKVGLVLVGGLSIALALALFVRGNFSKERGAQTGRS